MDRDDRATGQRGGPIVAILLILHVGLLLGGLATDYVVLDEFGHVPAGVSHWQTGSFALYRVNPPLARMIAALPILLARPAVNYAHLDDSPSLRADWDVGQDFLQANAPRYLNLIRLARLTTVAWSVVAALVIYRWSRALYGEWAGRLGLALWCFDPAVLTFGHLVIPDIPSASAAVLATYAFRRYLLAPSSRRAAVAGLLLGVAELTKFTLLSLYALWPLIWLLDRRSGRFDANRRHRLLNAAAHGLLIATISLEVINLGYGFQGSFRRLDEFRFTSRTFAGDLPKGDRSATANRFRGRWPGRLPVPLPAEFLQGIDAQRREFEHGAPSYLAGEWRSRGWWYYYVYALAVKEPLGTLALVAWALVLTLSGRSPAALRRDEGILWLSALAILVLVSSQTGFNHHMRYVLPMFPFVAVATSKLACLPSKGRGRQAALVAALLAWSVGSTLWIYPHTMSYFNEAAGGPARGHDHLLSSNIDWGQDLLALKTWLDRHPEARPLGFACYHFIDPQVLGIRYRLPPLGPGPAGEGDDRGPRPGYYAVSVNLLRGMIFSAPNGEGSTTWVTRHDAFTYFRRFRPIARAGHSIYIYRITPRQADEVRRSLGLPPL